MARIRVVDDRLELWNGEKLAAKLHRGFLTVYPSVWDNETTKRMNSLQEFWRFPSRELAIHCKSGRESQIIDNKILELR